MIETITTYRTRDGREFTERHEAEEHDAYLDVLDACRQMFMPGEAEGVAKMLTFCSSRENVRNLICVLEPFA